MSLGTDNVILLRLLGVKKGGMESIRSSIVLYTFDLINHARSFILISNCAQLNFLTELNTNQTEKDLTTFKEWLRHALFPFVFIFYEMNLRSDRQL